MKSILFAMAFWAFVVSGFTAAANPEIIGVTVAFLDAHLLGLAVFLGFASLIGIFVQVTWYVITE